MSRPEYDYSGAARFLGITQQAVSQHVRKGYIKTVWRGHLGAAGRRMISEVDLLTFVWSDYYTRSKSNYEKLDGSEGE